MDYDDDTVEGIHENDYYLRSKGESTSTSAPSTSVIAMRNTIVGRIVSEGEDNTIPNDLSIDYTMMEDMEKMKVNIYIYDIWKLT